MQVLIEGRARRIRPRYGEELLAAAVNATSCRTGAARRLWSPSLRDFYRS
jgi:hypothetical protein